VIIAQKTNGLLTHNHSLQLHQNLPNSSPQGDEKKVTN